MVKSIILIASLLSIIDVSYSQIYEFDSFEDLEMRSSNGQNWNYNYNTLEEFKDRFASTMIDTTFIDEMNLDVLTTFDYGQSRFTFCNQSILCYFHILNTDYFICIDGDIVKIGDSIEALCLKYIRSSKSRKLINESKAVNSERSNKASSAIESIDLNHKGNLDVWLKIYHKNGIIVKIKYYQ